MCISEAGVVGGICGRHGCHFISTANGAKYKNRDSQTSYISRYQIQNNKIINGNTKVC